MAISHPFTTRLFHHKGVPFAVALAGALLTLWLARGINRNDEVWLDRRFQSQAQERIEPAARLLAGQAYPLNTMQWVLSAADVIDQSTLVRIVDPLRHGTHLRDIAWAPCIELGERAGFEREGGARRERPFAITEFDAERRLIPAAPREVYFPIAFGVPREAHLAAAGLDLFSLPEWRALINESITEGVPRASHHMPFALEPARKGAVAFVVPVYAARSAPTRSEARHARIRGVLVATLDVVSLFDATLASGSGLRVSLSDTTQGTRILHRWPSDDAGGADKNSSGWHNLPEYSRSLSLAGHSWIVRVEPDSGWLSAHATHRAAYFAAFGLILSLVSFFGVRILLRRGMRAEELERSHDEVTARLRESENRFRSAMAVMAEGLVVISSDSVCRFANRTAKEILRIPGQILQGRDMRQLPVAFLNVDGEEVASPLESDRFMSLLCRKRELRNSVAGLRFADGSVRWLKISTSPLRTG
ncbi:MAG: CHASE domain-containing protein, partial [Candidatus Accumulibacter sp.]|nr:CHASE domain-containing protein [Accumulibacter sp.]